MPIQDTYDGFELHPFIFTHPNLKIGQPLKMPKCEHHNAIQPCHRMIPTNLSLSCALELEPGIWHANILGVNKFSGLHWYLFVAVLYCKIHGFFINYNPSYSPTLPPLTTQAKQMQMSRCNIELQLQFSHLMSA